MRRRGEQLDNRENRATSAQTGLSVDRNAPLVPFFGPRGVTHWNDGYLRGCKCELERELGLRFDFRQFRRAFVKTPWIAALGSMTCRWRLATTAPRPRRPTTRGCARATPSGTSNEFGLPPRCKNPLIDAKAHGATFKGRRLHSSSPRRLEVAPARPPSGACPPY